MGQTKSWWLLILLLHLGCATAAATTEDRPAEEHNNGPELAWAQRRDNNNNNGLEATKGAARTYERVVLEGSRIVIGCPYPPPLLPPHESSFATETTTTPTTNTVQLNNGSRPADSGELGSVERKQFAGQRQQQGDLSAAETHSDSDSSDVDVDVSATTAARSRQQVKWFRNHVPLATLNYFQLPSLGSLGGDPSGDKEELLGPTESVIRQQQQEQEAPNVNLATSSWYINKFGELVINRVSQYFAGKYTCLWAGRQSELLLDVLVAEVAGVADPLGAGNGPIEKGKGFELGRAAASISLPLDQFRARQPVEASKEEEQFVGRADNNSLADANRSLGGGGGEAANSIKTARGGDTGADFPGAASATGSNERLAIRAAAVGVGVDSPGPIGGGRKWARQLAAAAKLGDKWASTKKKQKKPKKKKSHQVEAEIIQMEDLKSVSGFLYSRQRFYCPLRGDGGGAMLAARSLVADALCYARRIASDQVASRRCYHLAGRLIRRLLQARGDELDSPIGGNCSGRLEAELVWLKDGRRLHFGPNGRAGELNMKLVTTASLARPSAKEADECKQAWRPARALELEGLRRESAGQFTCAHSLSAERLADWARAIRQLNKQQQRQRQDSDNNGHDNDASLGDDDSGASKVEQTKEGEQQSSNEIETNSPLVEDKQLPPLPEVMAPLATSQHPQKLHPRASSSFERIEKPKLGPFELANTVRQLESILGDAKTTDDGKSLDYLAERLTSAASEDDHPWRHIQSFSLSVLERPANRCGLWQTLEEAGDAYARRKLADFKRLKRSLAAATSPAPNEAPPTSGARAQMNNVAKLATTTSVDANAVGFWPSVNTNDDDGRQQQQQQQGGELARRRRHLTRRGRRHAAADRSSKGRRVNNSGAKLRAASDIRARPTPPVARVAGGQNPQLPPPPPPPFNYANERNLKRPTGANDPRGPSDNSAGDNYNYKATNTKDAGAYLDSPKTKDLITQKGYHALHLAAGGHFEAQEAPSDFLLSGNGGSDLGGSKGSRGSRSSELINDWAPVAPAKPIIDGTRPPGQERVMGGDKTAAAGAEDAWWKYKSDGRRRRRRSLAAPQDSSYEAGGQEDKLPPFGATRYSSSSSSSSVAAATSATSDGGQWLNSQLTGPTIEEEAELDQSEAQMERPAAAQGDGDEVEERIGSQDGDHQADLGHSTPGDGGDDDHRPPLLKLLPYDSQSIDESLMWRAGQYLYMHMKALAASPIFGVEVSVEWSNERTNGTGLDLDPSDRDKAADLEQATLGGPPVVVYSRPRDAAPFATIDVIPGQNLQLQCTAQALGRLPEVKWYKRISAGSSKRLKGSMDLARRIGRDLYWPLTELDLLKETEEEDGSEDGPSFVCSQTTTIFDNLAKQTFTVIQSLQLSQYNDVNDNHQGVDSVQSPGLPLGNGNNFNLYACIVDADVRHNYATLGVHLREAPSKSISYEISQRLQARSTFSSPVAIQQSSSRFLSLLSTNDGKTETRGQKDYSRFDYFRENHVKFPMKPSYWVPIQNVSTLEKRNSGGINGEFLLTPTILSTIILFVLSSFLALVYLTVRTYRSLTLPNLLDSDDLNESQLLPEQAGQAALQERRLSGERMKMLATGKAAQEDGQSSCFVAAGQCLCHLELDENQPLPVMDNMYDGGSLYVDLGDIKESPTSGSSQFKTTTTTGLYDAHVHSDEADYSCGDFGLPAEHKLSYTTSYHHHHHRKHQLPKLFNECCQTTTTVSCSPHRHITHNSVSPIDNPLNQQPEAV